MQVKFVKAVSSLTGAYAPFEVRDLPDALARQWVAAGHAEAIEPAALAPEATVPRRPGIRRANTPEGSFL